MIVYARSLNQFMVQRCVAGLIAILGFNAMTALAQPAFSWAVRAGGTNHDFAAAIAADTLGNCYLTGESLSTVVSFGAVTLTNQGGHGILVASYDKTGTLRWARSHGQVLPASYPSRGLDVVTDEAGNCYVAGVFSGTVAFGATNIPAGGLFDMFVAKYDVGGNLAWIQRAGGLTAQDTALGARIVVDPSGNVCVAGQGTGSFTFTSAAGTNVTLAGQSVFLAKFDAMGNLIWVKQTLGDTNPDGLATDGTGNIYFAGDFGSATINFGGVTLTNQGDYDAFLAKFNAAGSVAWVKQVGGSGTDWPVGLATDANGNGYLACYAFSADTVVDGNAFTNGDRLLARFLPDGTLAWAKGTPLMGKLAALGSSHIFMARDFRGNIPFGPTTLTNAGDNYDVFLAAFDTAGNPLWAKQAGGPNLDTAWDLATDRGGNVYLCGEFQTYASFDSITLTNVASAGDVFVARMNSVPPRIAIQGLPGQVQLTWPVSTLGFQLQQKANLSSGTWESVTNTPIILGTNYGVIAPATGVHNFYRLKSP